jgi:hypothetical protein
MPAKKAAKKKKKPKTTLERIRALLTKEAVPVASLPENERKQLEKLGYID